MKNQLRVCFMGTPEFAVKSLASIVKSNHQVVGVVTAVDKPAGRGRKIHTSDVKKYALKNNLPVYQPTNLKSPEFQDDLKVMNPDVIVVVAFRMLPKMVWGFPKFGTFNLHASLLPNYRGAAPIHWAVINGEKETGVTTFFIDEKIDTGSIILSKKTPILSNENVGDVHDKLMEIGAGLVVETLDLIFKKGHDIDTTNQHLKKEKLLKAAPKLNKENTKINWNEKNEVIYNFVRGLNPFPAAWTVLHQNNEDLNMKIFKVTYENCKHNHSIGQLHIEKNKLGVYTNEGLVFVEELQLQGKKRMLIKDFLNGTSLDENSNLS